MRETFRDKLANAVQQNNSLVCVGLDPDPTLMPVQDVVEFTQKIIESTSDLVCCYKPNIAFFEALGLDGLNILHECVAAIPDDIPFILDAKRGDIGNTAAGYAGAAFDVLGADAMTVNVYGGKDSVEPFLEYEDKGVLVLTRMSNPSSTDFQDLDVKFEGRTLPLWEVVAMQAQRWNTRGNVGIVMGATFPAQLSKAREICPDMPILVPGIGAQEGALRDAVLAGLTSNKDGAIISASRSVLYASRDSDYGLAARSAAAQLREQVNRYRNERPVPAEA